MRRPFKQHLVVQMCILALAIEPSLAFARHGHKKEDGELSLVSIYVGKNRVENVRQYFVPMGNTQGFVIEKLGKGGVLLERVVTWGDKTQIEIDSAGTGYLHEWEAFSDNGHIKMGAPGNGHFATMSVEVLTGDKRVEMHFVRNNEEDVYTLVAQSSSPLVPMFDTHVSTSSELVSGPNQNGGANAAVPPGSASQEANDVRANIGADVDKLNSTIDSLNKDSSCKNKKPMVDGIAEVMRSDTHNPSSPATQKYLQCIQSNGGSAQNCKAPDNNRYLQCLHSYDLNAIADHIDAQFYGTAISSKGSGTPSWSISCQDCASPSSSTTTPTAGAGGSTSASPGGSVGAGTAANSSGAPPSAGNSGTGADLCKGQPKSGAFAPSSKDGGVVSFIQNCQTSKSSSNNSADSCLNSKGAKSGTLSTSDYARTFFHEMLHKNGLSEKDVASVMKCCAPEDGKKPSCGGMDAVGDSAASTTLTDVNALPASEKQAITNLCDSSAYTGSESDCERSFAQARAADIAAECGSNATAACQANASYQAVQQTFGPSSPNCVDKAACSLAAAEVAPILAPGSSQAQAGSANIQARIASYCASGGTDCSALKTSATVLDASGAKAVNYGNLASTGSGNNAGLSAAAAAGGPQMKKTANFNSFYKGVSNAFSAATQIANAPSEAGQNTQTQAAAAPTMANPTEPHPPFNLATAQGNGTNPAPVQSTVTTVAANAPKGKSEAIAGKTTAAPRDPAGTVGGPAIAAAAGPAKAAPKNLSAAAQGVREKAKKGDAVARQKFVKQMTQLEPEEMHLALADEQVQNSLLSYVVGVIDDEGKKRDRNASPADWLIFNHQAQHLVYKESTTPK